MHVLLTPPVFEGAGQCTTRDGKTLTCVASPSRQHPKDISGTPPENIFYTINNAFCKSPAAWRQRAPAVLSDRALRALPLKEGGCFISLKVWQLVLAPELVPRTNGGSKNECPYSVDTDVAKDEQR